MFFVFIPTSLRQNQPMTKMALYGIGQTLNNNSNDDCRERAEWCEYLKQNTPS